MKFNSKVVNINYSIAPNYLIRVEHIHSHSLDTEAYGAIQTEQLVDKGVTRQSTNQVPACKGWVYSRHLTPHDVPIATFERIRGHFTSLNIIRP